MSKQKPTLNLADVNLLKRTFFTREDFSSVKDLIKVSLEEAIDEKGLLTKDDISHLPTKDEFYEKMDEVMGELKTIREEHSALSSRSRDHSDDLEKLKKIHPSFEHA